MTDDYDSIVGMTKSEPLRRFTTGIPTNRLEPAVGAPTMSGIAFETDDVTGLASESQRCVWVGCCKLQSPTFWTA